MATRKGIDAAVIARRRRAVRSGAAAVSAGCAIAWVGIGTGLVVPVPGGSDDTGVLLAGLAIGLAYALGTIALLVTDRLGAWIAGTVIQIVAIGVSLGVVANRGSAYAPWGVVLSVAAATILVALLFLMLTPGGRCPCAICDHHRDLHHGRCFVPGCSCEVFL